MNATRYVLVLILWLTLLWANGCVAETKNNFDSLYKDLQRPLSKQTIPSNKVKATGLTNESYFNENIFKMTKLGDQFLGAREFIFARRISDLMAIKLTLNLDHKIVLIAAYYDFKNTTSNDETRESINARYAVIQGNFGDPIVKNFKIDRNGFTKGYCIFDAKEKYILFGSYGETDLVICEFFKLERKSLNTP